MSLATFTAVDPIFPIVPKHSNLGQYCVKMRTTRKRIFHDKRGLTVEERQRRVKRLEEIGFLWSKDEKEAHFRSRGLPTHYISLVPLTDAEHEIQKAKYPEWYKTDFPRMPTDEWLNNLIGSNARLKHRIVGLDETLSTLGTRNLPPRESNRKKSGGATRDKPAVSEVILRAIGKAPSSSSSAVATTVLSGLSQDCPTATTAEMSDSVGSDDASSGDRSNSKAGVEGAPSVSDKVSPDPCSSSSTNAQANELLPQHQTKTNRPKHRLVVDDTHGESNAKKKKLRTAASSNTQPRRDIKIQEPDQADRWWEANVSPKQECFVCGESSFSTFVEAMAHQARCTRFSKLVLKDKK